MRIRILAASAVLAAALAAPAVPAVADEGGTHLESTTVTEELEQGAAGPSPSPAPTAPAAKTDLGWG
ncbi:hypothetical protein [Streptomyces sp. NPDC057428]|uniref:hypothetical protein n=1 Tax=Streptomyces sp. NPDC057428 TaxID=3346129 RepID=UPI0036AE4282